VHFWHHLRAVIRDSDEVARMGGEEFMLIVRQPPTHVHAVVDRVVSSWRLRSPLSTLSAGVAVHDATRSPSDTYRALYAAKAGGRDRTEIDIMPTVLA
jgi:GGDEF domain-containing protein